MSLHPYVEVATDLDGIAYERDDDDDAGFYYKPGSVVVEDFEEEDDDDGEEDGRGLLRADADEELGKAPQVDISLTLG